MSTHNICFCAEIRKIFTGHPPLSRPMISEKYFSYFSMKTCCGFSYFYGETEKIDQHIIKYSSLTLTTLGGLVVSALGPVVQSIVSLTSSLRVISLTVLADSIYSILIFFAEKM